MKTSIYTCLFALMIMMIGYPAMSADDVEPVPIPIDPQKIDLNGTWNYKTFGHSVTGQCPNGTPMSGTISITQKGTQLGLKIDSGAVCKPAAVCQYTGSLEGNHAKFSNLNKVDDEGGEVINAIGLSIVSNTMANGDVSSRYRHPKGFECHWTHKINLSREDSKE